VVRAPHTHAFVDVLVAGVPSKAIVALAFETADLVHARAGELVLTAICVDTVVGVCFTILSRITIVAIACVVIVTVGTKATPRTIRALIFVAGASIALPAVVAFAGERIDAIFAGSFAVASDAVTIVNVLFAAASFPPKGAQAHTVPLARPIARTTDTVARICCFSGGQFCRCCLGGCGFGRRFFSRAFP